MNKLRYVYCDKVMFESHLMYILHLTFSCMQALKLFSSQKEYFDKLVELSIVSLAKDGGSDDGFSLSSAIVNFVFQKAGIQNAREMYKRYVIRY